MICASERTKITAYDQRAAIAGDRAASARMIAAVETGIGVALRQSQLDRNKHDDCAQSIRAALLEAIPKWDESRGAWITYAMYRVRGAMLDWMRMEQPVGARRGRIPMPVLVSIANTVDENGTTLSELLEQDHADEGRGLIELADLRDFLMRSSTRCKVLAMYYLDCMGMKQIGKALGLSESRVSQIHKQAMGDKGLLQSIIRLAGLN